MSEPIRVKRRRPGQVGIVLSVRLTPEQFEALCLLAEQDGAYTSTLARRAIAEYTARRMSNLVTPGTAQTANETQTVVRLEYAR